MSNRPVFNLDITDYDTGLTEVEIKEAESYITTGQWIEDSIIRAKASVMTGIRSTVCIVPCDGWCHDNNKSTDVLRRAGNDKALTKGIYLEHIQKGTQTACRACSDRHFKIADALSYHLDLLECRDRKDDKGADRAVTKRATLLKQLGYTLA